MAATLIARSASEYCASLALYRASKAAASYNVDNNLVALPGYLSISACAWQNAT